MTVTREHPHRCTTQQPRHETCLLDGWDEPIPIGREKQCRHVEAAKRLADIVRTQDVQTIQIALAAHRAGQLQKPSDIVRVSMGGIEPECGQPSNQRSHPDRQDAQEKRSQAQSDLRREVGKGIQNHQSPDTIGVGNRITHGQRTTEGLADDDRRPAGGNALDHAVQIVNQRIHGRRAVTQGVGGDGEVASEQGHLTIKQQAGAVDPRHEDQRRTAPTDGDRRRR